MSSNLLNAALSQSATKLDKERLQQIVRAVEKIIRTYTTARKQEEKISTDPSHLGHHLFKLWPELQSAAHQNFLAPEMVFHRL